MKSSFCSDHLSIVLNLCWRGKGSWVEWGGRSCGFAPPEDFCYWWFLVSVSHLPIDSVGFINLGLGFGPFVPIEVYFFLLKIQCYCWAKQFKHNQPQEFLAYVIVYKEYTHEEKCYLLLKSGRIAYIRWCVFCFLFLLFKNARKNSWQGMNRRN